LGGLLSPLLEAAAEGLRVRRARRQRGRGLGELVVAGVGVGGRVEGVGVLFGEGVAGGRAWQKDSHKFNFSNFCTFMYSDSIYEISYLILSNII